MAGELHLYTTFIGGYSTAPASDETWQIGVRWRISNTAADPIGTLPTDWDPAASTINRDETNWTITGNWMLNGPSLGSFDVDDWLNDQVAPAAATFFGNARFGAVLRLRQIKAYAIGTDGKAVPAPPYATGTPITLTWKTGSEPSGSGTNILPLQNSIVVSLRTQQVGAAGRGRFYAPAVPPAAVANTSGQFDTSSRNAFATAAATFLTSCSFASTSPTARYVDPIVTGGAFTAYATVNVVRVGSVIDTQRRRRRSLTEVYSDVAVPVE